MDIKDIINIDADILEGQAVFKGTRVSVESLFDHLKAGVSLDESLEDFPTVSEIQTVSLLEIACRLLPSKNVESIYEAAT